MSERGRQEPRWRRRPDGSNWGDFGADDQLGRLNLLTPAKVLQGISEVHEGKTFCLSLPLDLPGGTVLSPSRFPPILRPTLRNGAVRMNYRSSRDDPTATEIVCDDVAILHTQYSTQWDSLAHAGYLFDADDDGVAEPVYYNGYRAGVDIVGPTYTSDARIAACCDLRSTSHLHAYAREVDLTQEEWKTAIDFLHRAGGISTDGRNEFIQASDVPGLSSLIEMLQSGERSTERSLLGPFRADGSPNTR